MARHRQELQDELTALERTQDDLLDKLIAESGPP
jgi:hypothetical protein